MGKKKTIKPSDIDPSKLLLLEEGHCLRSQISNLCELMHHAPTHTFDYETGSLETLKRIVERDNAITILPELATHDLKGKRQHLLKHFAAPTPYRQVSLITHRDFMKAKLIKALIKEIKKSVPQQMLAEPKVGIVPVD